MQIQTKLLIHSIKTAIPKTHRLSSKKSSIVSHLERKAMQQFLKTNKKLFPNISTNKTIHIRSSDVFKSTLKKKTENTT